MKNLLLLSLALISTSALAAPRIYQIDIEYTLKGQPTKKARVKTAEGKEAEIADLDSKTNSGTYVSVTPTHPAKIGNEQVTLSFTLGKIVNGKKSSEISRPQIVALEKESASVSGGTTGEQPDFKISALPIRLAH